MNNEIQRASASPKFIAECQQAIKETNEIIHLLEAPLIICKVVRFNAPAEKPN